MFAGELLEAVAGDVHDGARQLQDFQTRRVLQDPFDGRVGDDDAHLQLEFTQTWKKESTRLFRLLVLMFRHLRSSMIVQIEFLHFAPLVAIIEKIVNS